MSDLPEPWATWATQVGVRPSRTGIGEAAGLPTSTVSRLIQGRTTQSTVNAVATALRVTPQAILAAATGSSLGPWEPPLEAHMLDSQEREALSLLIQRIVATRASSPAAHAGSVSDLARERAETARPGHIPDRMAARERPSTIQHHPVQTGDSPEPPREKDSK